MTWPWLDLETTAAAGILTDWNDGPSPFSSYWQRSWSVMHESWWDQNRLCDHDLQQRKQYHPSLHDQLIMMRMVRSILHWMRELSLWWPRSRWWWWRCSGLPWTSTWWGMQREETGSDDLWVLYDWSVQKTMLRIVKSFKDSGSGLNTARLSAAINPALSMLPPSAQVLYCTVLHHGNSNRGGLAPRNYAILIMTTIGQINQLVLRGCNSLRISLDTDRQERWSPIKQSLFRVSQVPQLTTQEGRGTWLVSCALSIDDIDEDGNVETQAAKKWISAHWYQLWRYPGVRPCSWSLRSFDCHQMRF